MVDSQIRALLTTTRVHLRPPACPLGWACLDHERLERLAGDGMRAANRYLAARGAMLDVVPGPEGRELRVAYVHPDALAEPVAEAA